MSCPAVALNGEEVIISRNEIVRPARYGAGENLVVVRVSAYRLNRVNPLLYFVCCLGQETADIGCSDGERENFRRSTPSNSAMISVLRTRSYSFFRALNKSL